MDNWDETETEAIMHEGLTSVSPTRHLIAAFKVRFLRSWLVKTQGMELSDVPRLKTEVVAKIISIKVRG